MASPRFPILFVTSSRIGDAVLSSGLIRRLSDEIPHSRFTIVAGPLAAPLFRDVPNLDRLIALEKAPLGLHWLSLWRQARGRRWGLVVDMRGSGLARFLNARRRATRRAPPAGSAPLHKVVEAARVLRVDDDPPAPFLYTSPKTEAAADALLGEGGPILAIAPAANWAGKTWPSERYAVVAAELLSAGGAMADGRLLLLGGPEDRFAAEAVRRVIPRARLIDTVGRTDLLTAYALLKRARLFIGNDSGLMHLSAAAGAPTLGLFGPSDDRLYGPWGADSRVLRGPRDFAAFKAIDPELNQVVCHMFDLPTTWVANAARRLLEDTAPRFGAADLAPETSALKEAVDGSGIGTGEPVAAPVDVPVFADGPFGDRETPASGEAIAIRPAFVAVKSTRRNGPPPGRARRPGREAAAAVEPAALTRDPGGI